ncbi:MAG: hypothetical protein ABL999_16325 [Pyrinomonadaceae bacterium]
MRRSIMLSTILTASVAVLGACTNEPIPNKPPTTPAPVATASPVASPVASPTGSPTAPPAKPGASPEVKKIDNANMKKEAAPAATATPKAT